MERIAFAIYLLVLVISPLLFGAVHAYAYSLVFLLILAASLLLVVHNIKKDYKTGSYYFQYPGTGLNVLFYLVFVLLVAQVVTLPSFVVGLLSPEALGVKQKAIDLTGRQEAFALAPYIYPVRMSLVRWTVYGLFFLGLSQVLSSRRRVEVLCFCILITAGFVSVYGIYQAYAGENRIWWFSGYGGDVRGTYINRNHFGGLMSMALILAAGYASSVSGRYYRRKDTLFGSSRVSILQRLTSDQRYSKRILIIFCGVIIGLGLVLSASRGAIVSAALGLLLLGVFYVYRESQRRNGFIILILFLLVGGYGLQIGMEHTIERFQPDKLQTSLEGRFRYARKTMEVFKDYKLAGVGVGNFQHAYPRYQAPEDMGLLVDYAHNDWAQLLAEAGSMGLIIVVTGMCLFVFFTLRSWLERKDPQSLALGVVPLAVLMTIGVHSILDFNMHIPANVLVLAAIVAAGKAMLYIKVRKYGEKFTLRFQRIYIGGKGFLLVLSLFLLIAWCMSWSIRHFAAETFCSTVVNSTLIREKNPPAAKVVKAISWDGYNAEYWYKLARAHGRSEDVKEEKAGSLDNMTESLERAVLLNPFAAIYYQALGWAYAQRWQQPDYEEKWLPKADLAMDLAGVYAGARDPRQHSDIAKYWLMRSKTLDPASQFWEAALAKVGSHYQQALDLVKVTGREGLFEDIRRTVWSYYPDAEIFRRIGIVDRSQETGARKK